MEGEGALDLHIRNGEIKDLKFRIFEPPRFFEAFLEGRDFTEAPDITSRICGICPIAYQMGAAQAMEDALQEYDLEILEMPLSPNKLFELLYRKEE